MRNLQRSQWDIIIFLSGVSGVVFLDRLTKNFFSGFLDLNESIAVIRNFFHFTLVHNTGIAFGFFKDQGRCSLPLLHSSRKSCIECRPCWRLVTRLASAGSGGSGAVVHFPCFIRLVKVVSSVGHVSVWLHGWRGWHGWFGWFGCRCSLPLLHSSRKSCIECRPCWRLVQAGGWRGWFGWFGCRCSLPLLHSSRKSCIECRPCWRLVARLARLVRVVRVPLFTSLASFVS